MSNSIHDRKKEKIIESPKQSPYTITYEGHQKSFGNQDNTNFQSSSVNFGDNSNNLNC